MHASQLSRVRKQFPGQARTGLQISRIKSSYELFCALIWNLPHFIPKFPTALKKKLKATGVGGV